LITWQKVISYFKSSPVFVLRPQELADPWKVELRDALNAKDQEKARYLLDLAAEKQRAEQRSQFH
jgi:hypothetical protein